MAREKAKLNPKTVFLMWCVGIILFGISIGYAVIRLIDTFFGLSVTSDDRLAFLVLALIFGFTGWMFYDAYFANRRWKWVFIIILTNFIGAAIYYFMEYRKPKKRTRAKA